MVVITTRSVYFSRRKNNFFIKFKNDHTPVNIYSNRKGTTNHCLVSEIILNFIDKSMIKLFTYHKNTSCIILNKDRVLMCIIVLEEYSPYIHYILVNKCKVVYLLSRLPRNGNQKTTHESNYLMEICQKFLTSIKYLKMRFQ